MGLTLDETEYLLELVDYCTTLSRRRNINSAIYAWQSGVESFLLKYGRTLDEILPFLEKMKNYPFIQFTDHRNG